MTTSEVISQHVARLPESMQRALLDYVLSLEQQLHPADALVSLNLEERRQKLAQALKEATCLDPFREISDPVAWQRELRQDRPLLDREGCCHDY
ncbi:MAG: hypothetical protein HQL91_11940 [Magnetococcales bacterium]|nr:hypothetical protein [Magnetococcales bacterium]